MSLSQEDLVSIQNLLLAAAVGFGLAVILGVPLGYWLLRRFIGSTQGTLARVVEDATAAAEAAAARADRAAVSHAGRALREAVAWYGPVAARRFAVQTALGLIVTFGGLVGTALLFRQTLLLSAQNDKIDRQVELLTDQNRQITLQTVTADAQRRGGLSSELFAILEAVAAGNDASSPGFGQRFALSRGLTARIVTFSLAAEPYWTVRVPTQDSNGAVPPPELDDQPRSPERGQLLLGLLIAGVDLSSVINLGATFERAILTAARLSEANLASANLGGATLTSADLSGATLAGARLTAADLTYAILTTANLTDADLMLADLAHADLSGATLAGAQLGGANLSQANLTGATLTDAYLFNANLTGATLTDAEFTGAIVKPGQVIPEGWESYQDGERVILRRRQ